MSRCVPTLARAGWRAATVLILLGLLTPGAVQSQPSGSRAERVLFEGNSPQDLRIRLTALADSQAAVGAETAGQALYYLGASFERSSMQDSAAAAYALALGARKGRDERLALIDLLLRRRGTGDIDRAIVLARQGKDDALMGGGRAEDYVRREAWALSLAGRVDTALVLFEPFQDDMRRSFEGLYRLGMTRLKANDPRQAFSLLAPLGVASRMHDLDVMKQIDDIAQSTGVGARLRGEITRQITARDMDEMKFLDTHGAKRLRFLGADGFRLAGAQFSPAGTTRRRAAIVLAAPGDSVVDYDSLAVALRAAGLAVVVMDVRGSGQSVDDLVPLPDTWRGREERLQLLAAQDVRVALRALAASTPLDTSSYLVGGVGASAPIAVRAATLDRRVSALVLVSPELAPVERGPTRARIAELQVPAFFQVGPDDRPHSAVTEALFHAGAERKSRIADSKLFGRGPLQFHNDPAVAQRLTRWVKESMPASARRTPRRSSPKPG